MSFTEEQIAFRDTVRKMVAKHVAPIAAEIDETDRFPLELVKLFGEMGLMQLWVPERYGGPNGNLTMACLAREEISKVSPACASIAALNTMFIMPLLHFGSEEQRPNTCRSSPRAASSRRSRYPSLRPAPTSPRSTRVRGRTATATSSTAASNGAAMASSPTTSW